MPAAAKAEDVLRNERRLSAVSTVDSFGRLSMVIDCLNPKGRSVSQTPRDVRENSTAVDVKERNPPILDFTWVETEWQPPSLPIEADKTP